MIKRGKYRIPFYMSTDCENLLKRFLVLNPMKRGVLTNIMNDKWININYEADNLQPYKEPDLFNALSEDRIGNKLRQESTNRLRTAGSGTSGLIL